MTFEKKIHSLLNAIEKDCLKLKRYRYLTEYGEGQLDLITIIKEVKVQNR